MFESPLKKNPYLQSIVENLPDTPGCYQYLNKEGTVIYVGKAKHLKRRVSQYFQKEHTGKTRVLVNQIADIRYVVVKTEEDALLLENNLIKKYKPRYNVLLKDDKTYPSICITGEYFPKVFKTRKILRNGSQYFGPYSHMPTLNEILNLIKQLYTVRTCNLALTPENIRSGKFKPCLDYHIKRCKAPCIALQSREEYMEQIGEIRQILRGNTKELSRELMDEMKQLSEEMRFEEAMEVKRKYDALERFREKSEVVSHIIDNIDVFSIEEDGDSAFINYLHITNGAINQAFTFEYKKKMNESQEELLALGIVEMRERYKSQSKEIVVPFPGDINLEGVTFTVPRPRSSTPSRSARVCSRRFRSTSNWINFPPTSSASTTPTSRVPMPWQPVSSSAWESPASRSIANTISKPSSGPMTMPQCAKWCTAATHAWLVKGLPYPTSSLLMVARGRWRSSAK